MEQLRYGSTDKDLVISADKDWEALLVVFGHEEGKTQWRGAGLAVGGDGETVVKNQSTGRNS